MYHIMCFEKFPSHVVCNFVQAYNVLKSMVVCMKVLSCWKLVTIVNLAPKYISSYVKSVSLVATDATLCKYLWRWHMNRPVAYKLDRRWSSFVVHHRLFTKTDVNDVRKTVIWVEKVSINRTKVKYDIYFLANIIAPTVISIWFN